MAITGRFEADFEDFYAAVDKAEAKLTDFQSGAGKVESSLNRMVDSFSGRRILQEATIAAEAVERIGGTANLTSDELERVGGVAQKAVEKLTALGIEVPEGIRRIADEATKASYAIESTAAAAKAATAQVEAEAAAAAKEVQALAAAEREAATEAQSFVDKFNGKALIDEATKSAAAIEKIGGSSKLTGTELQAVAGRASEAVAKMKALGVEVPPAIQSLADKLKPIPQEVDVIKEQFIDMGKRALGAFAVEKVIEFTLEIGKAQQQLVRLSAETQVSTDDLQDLTAATKDYGLSNEELGKALFTIGKGIAGGDESIVRGLHKIGLSIDEVKDKHGKELFLDIERGLAQLQGSLRDTAAADIFGSKLGAAMAGFAKEADAAVKKAEEFNAKLSPDEIAKLKGYADQVERLKNTFGTFKDKAIGESINAVQSLGYGIRYALGSARDFFTLLATGKPGTVINDLVANYAKLAEEQKAITAGAKEAQEQSEQGLSKEAQAIQFLSALRRDAVKELEPYQKRGLEDLKEMGQLNQANAAAIGISVDQFKKYTEEVRVAELATKALADATLANNTQVEKIRSTLAEEQVKQTGTKTEIELAGIQKSEDAEINSLKRRSEALKLSLASQHADSKDNLDAIDAQTAETTKKIEGYYDEMRERVGIDFDEIRSHSQASLDDARDRALKTLIEARSQVGTSRAELDRLTENYRKAAFAATAMGQQSAEASDQSTKAIEQTNEKLIEQFDIQARLQEIERSKGGSTEVTAANFDTYTAPQGLQKSSILALLKQGFSLQNAIDILTAQARGVGIDLSKWPEEARGPRVPGFKYGVREFEGGDAIVGEDGPELVQLPKGASVIPLQGRPPSSRPFVPVPELAGLPYASRGLPSRGGGGSSTIFAPVYVSGVFDPSSAHKLGSTVSEAQFHAVTNARVLR